MVRIRYSAPDSLGALVVPAGLVLAGLVLAGCTASALVGAGATAGVAVAQERSVGAAIDDTKIKLLIGNALLHKDPDLFRRVDVDSVEGRVLLTGSVKQADDRVEASRLAWQYQGVREVLNEIQVTDKSGLVDYAKDAWITTQLRTKIMGDTGILDLNYSIETVNGVIYLLGIAQDEPELDSVTGYARTIAGVRKVISHVRLKDDPRRVS